MADVREKQEKGQRNLMYALMKYEDIGLAYYSDADYNKRILTNPENADLKDKVAKAERKAKNPYKEAYIWLKGEYLDV